MGLFSGITGVLSGLMGGSPSKLALPPTPDYYTDPNFTGTQDFLKKYSENMLNGNIPDFYKSIGQTSDQNAGAGLMNDYVSQATAGGLQNDLEAGALTGRGRTGLSSNAINSANQTGGALRMADYLRAMEGKQWLMNTGLSGETGVRGAASQDMNQKNAFDQWKYNSDVTSQQLTNASANARKQYFNDNLNQVANGAEQAATAAMGGGAGSFFSSLSPSSTGNIQQFLDMLGQGGSSTGSKWAGYGQNDGIVSPSIGGVAMKSPYSNTPTNSYDDFMAKLYQTQGVK